jgi:mannan endo-1,4-beta-mannosidase
MIREILLSGGIAWVFVKIITLTFGLIALSRLLPGPNRQMANYRARPLQAAGRYGTGILALAALTLGCAAAVSLPRRTTPVRALPHRSVAVGMFAPGVNTSYAPEREFTSATGARLAYVLAYSAWPGSFGQTFARLVSSRGAMPVIQMMPGAHVSMARVADGSMDASLRRYADQARAFGRPVMLSFAPEANGNWYGWGWGHTPARTWVTAWRHVVIIFRQQHAANVRWLWTVNISFPHSGPVAAYWPGDAYVGTVGIDGYYAHRTDTFDSLFGPVLTQIRRLTSKPVLLSETAVGPVAGPSKIADLFAGVSANDLVGLIWFDQAQHDGPYHEDWRLEDNPSALAAFRAAAAQRVPHE